jgi:adhesin/invasin
MPFAMPRTPRRALALVTTALLAACGDDPAPVPAALSAVGESQYTGTVAELISTPLTVTVADARGRAVGGTIVAFTVAEGGGTVSQAIDTTDKAGVAKTTWRLGERAGPQRVSTTVAGVAGELNFVATARAAAPASIAANGGTGQSVVVGTVALTAPSVIIKDRFANPVSGVSVLFSIASGGGSVAGNAAVTNSAGIAATGEWRMGTTVGANTLTALALVGGLTGNPITFTATGTAGAAARVTAVGATALSGTVFKALTPLPQVRVTDASGNAVAGTTVTFTGSAGSTVAGGSKLTDASGLASPDSWVLGTSASSYTLTATVSGLTAATFTAAARADVATTMTATAGTSQTAPVGRALPVDPTVKITDVHGNPVAGVEVQFEVGSGGGSAVGRRATTSALGIAAVGGWTLGDEVGVNTLVASVVAGQGLAVNPVTFTATGTAGAPSSMVAAAGQNQNAAAGEAVATAPSVRVRDARGNPVSGVTVTFTVGSGGGAITGATAITNASGVAAVGSWVLGGSVGTQTLIARSGTLPEVTFTATATAGAATRVSAFSSQVQTGLVAGAALSPSQRPAVRVTDEAGNPVPNTVVTFRVAQGGSSGYLTGGDTVTTVATNSNGIATVGAWTMPVLAGVTATLSASVATIEETVTFSATTAAGSVARLRVTAGGLTTLATTAGAANTITITALDANNNTVAGYVGTKSLTFTGATVSPLGNLPTVNLTNFGSATSVTFTSGVATATLVLTKAESAAITASDGSVGGLGSSLLVTVTPGNASAGTSEVSAGALSVAQSGTTTITVTVLDAERNPVTSATADTFVAARSTSAGAAGALGAFSCSSGVCTAIYTAPAASGTNSIAVTIASVAIVGSPLAMVTP